MSFEAILAENRRLIILRALDEGGFTANETVLKSVVVTLGHPVTRELIRGDLTYLAEHSLVRLEKIDVEEGKLWVARLTTDGQDVAKGRAYPGVAKREPG